MSFLAPLFILGTTAIVLPLVFHLIRRSSRERIPFSSLMFLTPSPPRVTRRSRLENIFLLILRCLVICLLAFAFARPFLSRPVGPDPAAQAGQKILVLLDTSASMRRDGLWSDAVAKAKAILKKTTAADQLALVTFDRDIRTVVGFDQWSTSPANDRASLAASELDQLHPGWGATRLGNALIRACEMFESAGKETAARRRIVLISDLQEGSRLDGLQGFEWPRGMEVTIEAVKPRRPSNAGLQLASDRAAPAAAGVERRPIRVRVVNSPDSKREQLHLGWQRGNAGASTPAIDVYLPPGQSRVVPVPWPTTAGAPDPDRVVLTGDEQDFDNTIYVVPPEVERVRILYYGAEAPEDPKQLLYYLRRAFPETQKLAVEVRAVAPGAAVAPADLASTRLLVVSRVLAEAEERAVRSFLDQDRAVLLTLRSPTMGPVLGHLLGSPNLAVQDVADENYTMLSQIDFQHPLFAPFADPRYSDFTKIHFWKHRRAALDKVPGAHVLARFDDGDPALAEVPVGKGRVWVLTSGWQPEDSQLALSSKFVPLLYAMLRQSGGLQATPEQYQVGDEVPLTFETPTVTIRKPDASEVSLARGARFTATDQPGIYSIVSTQTVARFVVNLAPEESRTAPMAPDELERLGVPLKEPPTVSVKQVQQRREHLQAVELENRQKLWRWLIVAALVILVVETWLAGRLTRRATSAPAVS